jgi:hypothetical protein
MALCSVKHKDNKVKKKYGALLYVIPSGSCYFRLCISCNATMFKIPLKYSLVLRMSPTHILLVLEMALQYIVNCVYSHCKVCHKCLVIPQLHVQSGECGMTGNSTSNGKQVSTYIPAISKVLLFPDVTYR